MRWWPNPKNFIRGVKSSLEELSFTNKQSLTCINRQRLLITHAETVVSFVWTVMETPLGWVTINTIKHLSKDKTSQKHSRKFLIIFSEKSTKFSALETALFLSMRIKKFTFQESIRIISNFQKTWKKLNSLVKLKT